jgi:hypothetical protein
MTFVAALRHDRIAAPWLLDGPIDGDTFTICVEKVLLPHFESWRRRRHGQSRQPQGLSRLPAHPLSRRQVVLPSEILADLNPIEQVFAKLKHLLRKAAARTVEAICAAVSQILGTFTSEECANYFKNGGYASI